MTGRESLIKCVVWDLDNTMWDGIAVESRDAALPAMKPEVLGLVDRLAGRGVLSSISSRSDPSILALLKADPKLAGRFFAPRVAWQDKSESLRSIAEELGIGLASMVLVDDSPYERAEVRSALPQVLTLAPEEAGALLDLPALDPSRMTAESLDRVGRYREEERRKEAEGAFAGSREDFLRWCGMRVRVSPARQDDAPRIAEMAARTHRLNSSGIVLDLERVRSLIDDPRWFVPVVELSDRFGDYGLVGTAVTELSAPDVWDVQLFTLSCRVAGRGVSEVFLHWLLGQARTAGAGPVRTPVRIGEANLELRLLLRRFGFRAEPASGLSPGGAPGTGEDRLVTFTYRPADGPLPDPPGWIDLEVEVKS
ncbi:FkbH-like protein [Streptomyces nitrosporeus]|uniref:FkbH-like protein n=1 Tax=Streptomyces nitrosporeus TaxID=28894 RepID=A0A5J6FCL1_9ACTN|nr:FkbH-like protein [Streptomyces nitrosporeus]QEU72725.1 FkbH-like protein [Streptomyces nitrosporeus]GGY75601.1 haloacid dehalogenase [Streptomyces nitrosporeus]